MRAELIQEIPHLRRYAMSLARQRDEADDLVQECLVKALGAADKFQPGPNLRAWLFTILRNAFINKTRDRTRATALSDGMARLHGVSSPPAQHASMELRETSEAIDRLPPSQRQALILVVLQRLLDDLLQAFVDEEVTPLDVGVHGGLRGVLAVGRSVRPLRRHRGLRPLVFGGQ